MTNHDHDDLRSMGEMTRAEIRATFRETVRNRVPFYGEYVGKEDGEWVVNDEYLEMSVEDDSPVHGPG